jgi:hypothetical protein
LYKCSHLHSSTPNSKSNSCSSCIHSYFKFVSIIPIYNSNLERKISFSERFLNKHVYANMGENTLGGGGGQKFCHIVLVSRGVHVWISTMVILEHIFPNFLHNMVDYNTKNSIAKKIIFSNLYCEVPKYICGKKSMSLYIKKCKYIQKMIEMIFSLYEICSIY